MGRTWAIVKPLLILIVLVGLARFALVVAEAARSVVYIFSITVSVLACSFYFMFKARNEPSIKPLQLWAGNLTLFGVSQLLIVAGLLYTMWSGRPTLYHESERLISFLGYEPSLPQHIEMHVLNWMLIIPTVLTWVIGVPLAYFSRRKRG